MIKVDKENVEIEGIKSVIRAELTTLINSLYTSKTITEEELKKDFEDGFKTEEELKKECEQSKEELKSKLKDLVEELLKGISE